MSETFKQRIDIFKRLFLGDRISIWLTGSMVGLVTADYLIWKRALDNPDIYIYLRIGIYPIKFLAIIVLLNTALAIFSFGKEKEIDYLLMSANVFIALLIMVLEIFYIMHKI